MERHEGRAGDPVQHERGPGRGARGGAEELGRGEPPRSAGGSPIRKVGLEPVAVEDLPHPGRQHVGLAGRVLHDLQLRPEGLRPPRSDPCASPGTRRRSGVVTCPSASRYHSRPLARPWVVNPGRHWLLKRAQATSRSLAAGARATAAASRSRRPCALHGPHVFLGERRLRSGRRKHRRHHGRGGGHARHVVHERRRGACRHHDWPSRRPRRRGCDRDARSRLRAVGGRKGRAGRTAPDPAHHGLRDPVVTIEVEAHAVSPGLHGRGDSRRAMPRRGSVSSPAVVSPRVTSLPAALTRTNVAVSGRELRPAAANGRRGGGRES